MKQTRMTSQRIMILKTLKVMKHHPTAEMIYKEVKKDLPAITLATVYRNLNLLADLGEIDKLEINSEFRFDCKECSHQHFVCTKCGRIIDIMNDEVTEYALKKIKGMNLEPKQVIVKYKGLCSKCK